MLGGLRWTTVPLGQNAAQDARHEPRRGFRAVTTCQLDRLVHRDRAGNIGVQQFKDGNPQDRPVCGCHPGNPPILGTGIEFRVEFDVAAFLAAVEGTGTTAPWSLEVCSTTGWASPDDHIASIAAGVARFR